MSDRPDEADSDRRIATLFHESGPDHAPDPADLLKGGIARGRTRHNRRRVGTTFAAVAAIGVIGTAASVLPDLGGGGAEYAPAGQGGTSAQAQQPSVAKPTSPAVDPKTKAQPNGRMGAATADIPVKAAALPGGFTKLFPGKVTPAEARTGRIINNGREGQFAHFRWNGFTTTVGFGAFLGTPAKRCAELQDPDTRSASNRLTCKPRPDGTVLMTWTFTAPARDGGGKAQGASLFTKDGYAISIISYNQGTKSGPPLADQPPLTMAQLTTAATSDVWFK